MVVPTPVEDESNIHTPHTHTLQPLPTPPRMPAITENVSFDTVAREMRCKWSGEDSKASLSALQALLEAHAAALKAVPGVKSVQRVVCGGCLDYKVIVALDAGAFGAWEAAAFAPEPEMIAAMKKIPGVTTVETQTYTLMPV